MALIKIPKSTAEAKHFSRELKRGKLRRLYRGVYTDELEGSLESVVQKNWMNLVAHLVPDGILSHRSALELRPAKANSEEQEYVFVTGRHGNTIALPGLTIKVTKGNISEFIEPVLPNLNRSNETRALLENLSRTKTKQGILKNISSEQLEEFLGKLLQTRGEAALNSIRDQAKQINARLSFEKAFVELNNLISALLSSHTNPDSVLETQFAQSIAQEESYDIERIRQFEALALYLRRCTFHNRSFIYEKMSWKNISFFESYFSNYIEGTEFVIDEAEDIVFTGNIVENRHADSHDVLSLFRLVNDLGELSKTPKDSQELLSLLQERHAFLLRQRPDKRPGQWKKQPNKAGNSYFVEPAEVKGTLLNAFPIYDTLEEPLARAMFMMFLVSEVHPFDDGNGRVARVMMNAELATHDEVKILIPTVHRDNYLGGLRRATRDGVFQTFCRVLDQAQAYTASIDWADYGEARANLEKDSADKTPDEGLPIFYRALRALDLSDVPVD